MDAETSPQVKTISEKVVNRSFNGLISIVILFIASLFFVFVFALYTTEKADSESFAKYDLYILVSGVVIVYLSILYAQSFFKSKTKQSSLKQFISIDDYSHKLKGFYKKSGFKRPLRYFLPALVYIVFLCYSSLIFVMPSVNNYPGMFDYGIGRVIIALIPWLIILIAGIAYLYNRFTALASYIEISPILIIVRSKMTIHYIHADVLKEIIYYNRSGSLNYILFKTTVGKNFKFDATFLKNQVPEIQKLLKMNFQIKTGTKIIQRRSSSSGSSSRAGTFGRGRW